MLKMIASTHGIDLNKLKHFVCKIVFMYTSKEASIRSLCEVCRIVRIRTVYIFVCYMFVFWVCKGVCTCHKNASND